MELERIKDFNFLGITINENLSWNSHLNNLNRKLSRICGTLNRLKHFLPPFILKTIYNSLFLPHLNFGILTWGSSHNKVSKIQKRALRTIFKGKYNAHTEPLFKLNNLLKIEDIYTLSVIKFYYKYVHNSLPIYFSNFDLNRRSDIHPHNTRHRDLLQTNICNKAYSKTTLRYVLPKLINSLPNIISDKIKTHSLPGLSFYFKNVCLKGYSSECTIVNCYICS